VDHLDVHHWERACIPSRDRDSNRGGAQRRLRARVRWDRDGQGARGPRDRSR